MPGKVLTLKGIKPLGKVQWKRDNFYLYGAVEPTTGESYFYEFSHLDSYCFQLFINQLSDPFPDTLNFLQLDNAKFHKNIDGPENIIPIFQLGNRVDRTHLISNQVNGQPSYSPELNPIERFWQELKRSLQWENCQNLEELRQKVSTTLLHFDRIAIASLTGWDYLTQAILSATS